MGSFYEFVRAAMPWVAVGLLIAFLAARSAVKKKGDKNRKG